MLPIMLLNAAAFLATEFHSIGLVFDCRLAVLFVDMETISVEVHLDLLCSMQLIREENEGPTEVHRIPQGICEQHIDAKS
jgi:hypothetical protein